MKALFRSVNLFPCLIGLLVFLFTLQGNAGAPERHDTQATLSTLASCAVEFTFLADTLEDEDFECHQSSYLSPVHPEDWGAYAEFALTRVVVSNNAVSHNTSPLILISCLRI